MKKLSLDLEYCYGIRKLTAEFDFDGCGDVFVIYAPNGVMKTSLASTFRDLSRGELSSDRIWPERPTKRRIVDETGSELAKERVFVIEPYVEKYHSERVSTLLVNESLRQRYEKIHADINDRADALVADLEPMAGLKEGIKEELSDAITHDPNEFYVALGRIEAEVKEGTDTSLGDVVYSDIFNAKVAALLADPDFRSKIRDYIEKYDELVSKSTFFKKGVFTHNNAADVAKSLKANGFFRAQHSVYLRIGGQKTEVSTEKELESAIQSEKERILTDKQLRSAFEAMDKQITKNVDLRNFRTCLEQHPVLLPELENPERLRQKLWVAYLIRVQTRFFELVAAFNSGKARIAEIVEEARNEHTKWQGVIDIFNERFSVPFVVRIDNQVDVILRSEAPRIRFDFLEDADDKNSQSVAVEEAALIETLSSGEKRALYILNIIFEVQARMAAGQETLFVVDDIADSFDYKNKYAIIEYLKDVGDVSCFQQIILSHNFDFYRTVSSRLGLKLKCRMLASKSGNGVTLQPEPYQTSAPFSHWRKNLTDRTMLVASIPFLRNLAEFMGDDTSYAKLTSLLHVKPDTSGITIADLEQLIKGILRVQAPFSLGDSGGSVKDAVYKVADEIANSASENYALESKVALSIAIRLKAEEMMLRKIHDDAFWKSITRNQTIKLINRYRLDFPTDKDNIQVFEQVNLMTPENIHLNSFMYEPILDMSPQHLKRLYQKVCAVC
jgi:hypothetical protein